jgi:hypothetical protein
MDHDLNAGPRHLRGVLLERTPVDWKRVEVRKALMPDPQLALPPDRIGDRHAEAVRLCSDL